MGKFCHNGAAVVSAAGQSQMLSVVESITNVVIGYGLAILSQMLIYHALDIPVEFKVQLLIGVWFTAVSLVRTYIVRRVFNRWSNRNG